MVVHICNPSIWKAVIEKSQVQGQPGQHNELKARLGYIDRDPISKTQGLSDKVQGPGFDLPCGGEERIDLAHNLRG